MAGCGLASHRDSEGFTVTFAIELAHCSRVLRRRSSLLVKGGAILIQRESFAHSSYVRIAGWHKRECLLLAANCFGEVASLRMGCRQRVDILSEPPFRPVACFGSNRDCTLPVP